MTYYLTRIALWSLMFIVPLAAWYVLWGREKLKPKPSMAWLYKSRFGEWSERTLFCKSESVLWGRTLQLLGYGLSTILMFGDIDLTPLQLILPDWLDWIPPVMPVAVSIAGHIQVKLRKGVTEPLVVTAAPEAIKETLPEVAAMKEAKVAAVVAVEVAKAEGVKG